LPSTILVEYLDIVCCNRVPFMMGGRWELGEGLGVGSDGRAAGGAVTVWVGNFVKGVEGRRLFCGVPI
jgi:hypothetical protein